MGETDADRSTGSRPSGSRPSGFGPSGFGPSGFGSWGSCPSDPILLFLVALPLLVAALEPAALAAQQGGGLPGDVTPATVERGRQIFLGRGFCHTCHGRDGAGISGLGADLTDRNWRHGDGSFGYLENRIRTGVPAELSSTGVPMPPRGGARLTEEELRAVAAFVWTLSRRGGNGR